MRPGAGGPGAGRPGAGRLGAGRLGAGRLGLGGLVAALAPGAATISIWLITGAHTHFYTVDQKRIETTDPVTALTGYRYEATWEPGLLFVGGGMSLTLVLLAGVALVRRFTTRPPAAN